MFWAECFVWNEIFAKMCFTKCVYVPVEASENVWKTLCKSIWKPASIRAPKAHIYRQNQTKLNVYTLNLSVYTLNLGVYTLHLVSIQFRALGMTNWLTHQPKVSVYTLKLSVYTLKMGVYTLKLSVYTLILAEVFLFLTRRFLRIFKKMDGYAYVDLVFLGFWNIPEFSGII